MVTIKNLNRDLMRLLSVTVKIRVGIEGGRKPVLETASRIGAPILVSANSLWRNGKFGGWKAYLNHDVALDSGGFVAMKRYGGYRWTLDEYTALAKAMNPTWWAQMDFCCEPEIAGNSHEVAARIDRTADHLHALEDRARKNGQPLPMPVLQGWKPKDYLSGPIYDREWPDLVGIGSVCRRNVYGADGILAVIGALDVKVPPHVRFHLFGVKSQAIAVLMEQFPARIASLDSMAWAFRCRKQAHQDGVACDGALRAQAMESWYLKQQTHTALNRQLSFNLQAQPLSGAAVVG